MGEEIGEPRALTSATSNAASNFIATDDANSLSPRFRIGTARWTLPNLSCLLTGHALPMLAGVIGPAPRSKHLLRNAYAHERATILWAVVEGLGLVHDACNFVLRGAIEQF